MKSNISLFPNKQLFKSPKNFEKMLKNISKLNDMYNLYLDDKMTNKTKPVKKKSTSNIFSKVHKSNVLKTNIVLNKDSLYSNAKNKNSEPSTVDAVYEKKQIFKINQNFENFQTIQSKKSLTSRVSRAQSSTFSNNNTNVNGSTVGASLATPAHHKISSQIVSGDYNSLNLHLYNSPNDSNQTRRLLKKKLINLLPKIKTPRNNSKYVEALMDRANRSDKEVLSYRNKILKNGIKDEILKKDKEMTQIYTPESERIKMNSNIFDKNGKKNLLRNKMNSLESKISQVSDLTNGENTNTDNSTGYDKLDLPKLKEIKKYLKRHNTLNNGRGGNNIMNIVNNVNPQTTDKNIEINFNQYEIKIVPEGSKNLKKTKDSHTSQASQDLSINPDSEHFKTSKNKKNFHEMEEEEKFFKKQIEKKLTLKNLPNHRRLSINTENKTQNDNGQTTSPTKIVINRALSKTIVLKINNKEDMDNFKIKMCKSPDNKTQSNENISISFKNKGVENKNKTNDDEFNSDSSRELMKNIKNKYKPIKINEISENEEEVNTTKKNSSKNIQVKEDLSLEDSHEFSQFKLNKQDASFNSIASMNSIANKLIKGLKGEREEIKPKNLVISKNMYSKEENCINVDFEEKNDTSPIISNENKIQINPVKNRKGINRAKTIREELKQNLFNLNQFKSKNFIRQLTKISELSGIISNSNANGSFESSYKRTRKKFSKIGTEEQVGEEDMEIDEELENLGVKNNYKNLKPELENKESDINEPILITENNYNDNIQPEAVITKVEEKVESKLNSPLLILRGNLFTDINAPLNIPNMPFFKGSSKSLFKLPQEDEAESPRTRRFYTPHENDANTSDSSEENNSEKLQKLQNQDNTHNTDLLSDVIKSPLIRNSSNGTEALLKNKISHSIISFNKLPSKASIRNERNSHCKQNSIFSDFSPQKIDESILSLESFDSHFDEIEENVKTEKVDFLDRSWLYIIHFVEEALQNHFKKKKVRKMIKNFKTAFADLYIFNQLWVNEKDELIAKFPIPPDFYPVCMQREMIDRLLIKYFEVDVLKKVYIEDYLFNDFEEQPKKNITDTVLIKINNESKTQCSIFKNFKIISDSQNHHPFSKVLKIIHDRRMSHTPSNSKKPVLHSRELRRKSKRKSFFPSMNFFKKENNSVSWKEQVPIEFEVSNSVHYNKYLQLDLPTKNNGNNPMGNINHLTFDWKNVMNGVTSNSAALVKLVDSPKKENNEIIQRRSGRLGAIKSTKGESNKSNTMSNLNSGGVEGLSLDHVSSSKEEIDSSAMIPVKTTDVLKRKDKSLKSPYSKSKLKKKNISSIKPLQISNSDSNKEDGNLLLDKIQKHPSSTRLGKKDILQNKSFKKFSLLNGNYYFDFNRKSSIVPSDIKWEEFHQLMISKRRLTLFNSPLRLRENKPPNKSRKDEDEPIVNINY